MHQRDADFLRVDLRVVASDLAHEVVQLRHHLHAGKAPAGHDEGEQLAAQVLVVLLDGRFLQRADHVIAQVERVVQVLEGQRVLRQAAQPAEVGHRPQREDQVVVFDDVGVGQEPRGGGDGALLQIDRLDLAHVDLGRGQEAPQGADQIHQADGSGDHLGEHRLEDEVVVLGDEDDLVVVEAAQLLLELSRNEDPAEAAAEDHDAFRAMRGHRTLRAEDAAHPRYMVELGAGHAPPVDGGGGEHPQGRRDEVDPEASEVARKQRGGERSRRVHAGP